MARPRNFDPDSVLDIVRDVFWEHGFQGAAYDQLTAATGLNKPSLYAAFGDKTELFGKILDRYHARFLKHAQTKLSASGPASAAVQAWMESFIPVCSGARGQRGCLSINALLEGNALNPSILQKLDAYNLALEGLLRRRLEEGAAAGEFAEDFNVLATARAIMAAFTGMMVLARLKPSAQLVREAIARITSLLRPR